MGGRLFDLPGILSTPLARAGAEPRGSGPAYPCSTGSFWDAVQAKYRRLFEALPELDGVGTFTADEQRFWGAYRTFDVMHDGAGCDWGLEKRYRIFVTKLWDVVVGEFDKLLVHRTWATNMYEQQAQPDVYRRIFTDAVPTRNLYLVPSFTQNDRWWFQAYNPTVNQTPHDMLVVCETMDYHAGGALFPTFPGFYFQAGLETMLDVEKSNLKGASLDVPATEDWRTRSLTVWLWVSSPSLAVNVIVCVPRSATSGVQVNRGVTSSQFAADGLPWMP